MPSLQGNWYAARSMATITGTSSSCMGLISTDPNSSSCLTLDTRANLAGEFQIFPCFALVGRRAQKIGWMISDDQRYLGVAEPVHLLPQSAQCHLGAQQVLRRDAPHGQHDLRAKQRNLLLQVGQTLRGFAGGGIAIAGRTAF